MRKHRPRTATRLVAANGGIHVLLRAGCSCGWQHSKEFRADTEIPGTYKVQQAWRQHTEEMKAASA